MLASGARPLPRPASSRQRALASSSSRPVLSPSCALLLRRQDEHYRKARPRRAPRAAAAAANSDSGGEAPAPSPLSGVSSSVSTSTSTSTTSTSEEVSTATDDASPRPSTPPLSARALELAAEAAAMSAAFLSSSGGVGGNGGPTRSGPAPAGYRFAAACISPANETLTTCSVEDSDDDGDDDGGGAAAATATTAGAAAATRLPPSLSPLEQSLARAPGSLPQQQQQPDQPVRARQRALLQWAAGGPRRCLIVKKPRADAPRRKLVEIANWLALKGVACFVERAVHASELPGLPPFDPRSTAVDFAITLGGDGTVLHLASMFGDEGGGDTPLPPVVCFAMGTLGFLTAFSADDFAPCLERVLAGDRHPLYCTLRSRTRVDVLMPVQEGDGEDGDGGDGHGDEADDGDPRPPPSPSPSPNAPPRPLRRPAVRLASTRHVLNECVVDRGAFPHAVYMEIFVDGAFVTAAEADGLIVATPSGSTAYSMSAGGPMVSPSVACTLLTPLSPQSLSFRPLAIPESSELLISIPRYARSHARLSFDGRAGQRLPRGSALRVTTSSCPLPFINLKPLDGDFFEAIVEKLRWNTLIRGRAGVRPVPPAVLPPVVAGGSGGEDEEEEEGAAAPLAAPSSPPPPSLPALRPASPSPTSSSSSGQT